MARGRIVSKSLSTSRKVAKLYEVAGDMAEFCLSLFPLLVAHSDDHGRHQGDPFTVKHVCLPVSPRSVDEFAIALGHMHTAKLIDWYQVDEEAYIQIAKFDAHQTGLHKRTPSKMPGPEDKTQSAPTSFVGSVSENGTSRKLPVIPLEEKRTELNRREGKGEAPVVSPRRDDSGRAVNASGAWSGRGRAHYSQLQGDHQRCDRVTSEACARSVCVPAKFVGECRGQMTLAGKTPQQQDDELRAMVAQGLARYGATEIIGDRPYGLWASVWEERHGKGKPQPAKPEVKVWDADAGRRTREEMARLKAVGE